MTTLPAPITDLSPIVTPGHTIAPPPIQTSEPIVTSAHTMRIDSPGASRVSTDWVGRRVDLHGRSEEHVAPDLYSHHVEHNTVEIEKDFVAEDDVRAVVAEERRFNPRVRNVSEQVGDNAPTLLSTARVVQELAEIAAALTLSRKLDIKRVVKLPR